MSDDELKEKVKELVDKIDDEELLNDLGAFIQIAKKYIKLGPYLIDFKYKDINMRQISDMDISSSIKLTIELFSKYCVQLENIDIDKLINNGVIVFNDPSNSRSDYDKIIGSTSVVWNETPKVTITNNGKVTDAVMLSHELAHYIYGCPESYNDTFKSEIYAIFVESLMLENLDKMGYQKDTRLFTKIRVANAYSCTKEIYNTLYVLETYMAFKDISKEKMSRLFPGLSFEEYDYIINDVKYFLEKRENETEDAYDRRTNITIKMRYLIGCLVGRNIAKRFISDKSYINVIKKSYKYSEYDLIEFLKAIEVTLFDLKKEVADTIDELNRHEKIR